MAKASKASEHYRDATSKARRCGTCEHMLTGGGCEVVEGKVEPDYVCDSWEGKPVRATMLPHMAKVVALARREVPEHLASPRGGDDYDRYDQDLFAQRVMDRVGSPFSHAPGEEPSGRTRDYERVERGRVEHVSGHIQSALKAHLLAQHPGVYQYLQEGRDLEQLDEMHHTDHERHNMHPTHHYEPPDVIEHPADRVIGEASRSDVSPHVGSGPERSLITGMRLPKPGEGHLTGERDMLTGQPLRAPDRPAPVERGRLTGERDMLTGKPLRSTSEPVPFDSGPQDSERTGLIKHLIAAHNSPGGEWAGMGMPALKRLDQEYHEGHVFRPGEHGSYK